MIAPFCICPAICVSSLTPPHPRHHIISDRNQFPFLGEKLSCSDPLEGGGTIYSNGFFCSVNFRDRYIHRRELRLVSSESSSSVEYGIKKIFLIFGFYRELSRFKLLRKLVNSHCFYSNFPEFLPKFSPILLKFVKIFKNSVVDFISKDKQALLIVLIKFLWSKILDRYFKIQPFSSKTARSKLI